MRGLSTKLKLGATLSAYILAAIFLTVLVVFGFKPAFDEVLAANHSTIMFTSLIIFIWVSLVVHIAALKKRLRRAEKEDKER